LPLDPLSPAFWGCVAVAALAGFVRGFSGFGAALVLTPLLSLLVGVRDAAAATILLTGLTALQQVPETWRVARRRRVAPMALGCLATIPLGAWALAALDADLLRRSVAAVVIAFAAVLASGWRYRGPTPWPASVGVGAASGVLTGAAGIGGPPVVLWTLAGGGDAREARADFVLFFAITLTAAAAAALVAGTAGTDTLLAAALLTPAFAGATWLGGRAFRIAPERAFRRAALAILFASGLAALLA